MTNAEIQERKQEVKRQNGFREEREEKKIARQIELNFTQNVLKLAPSSLNASAPICTYIWLSLWILFYSLKVNEIWRDVCRGSGTVL